MVAMLLEYVYHIIGVRKCCFVIGLYLKYNLINDVSIS